MATSLTNSFIIARVDYCNSFLVRLIKHQTGQIQSILYVAACVIYGQARFGNIILRARLHWLRVPQRNEFKLCLLMYKAIHELAPAYITNYCIEVPSKWCLRSSHTSDSTFPLFPRRWCSANVHSRSVGWAYGAIFHILLSRRKQWSCSSRTKNTSIWTMFFLSQYSPNIVKCPWLWSWPCLCYSKYYHVNNNYNNNNNQDSASGDWYGRCWNWSTESLMCCEEAHLRLVRV